MPEMTIQHPIPAEAARAKADFARARHALLAGYRHIPKERRGWSPAPTARTPIALVLHCATALGHIREMLEGTPFAVPTPAEADAMWREIEQGFHDGDAALARFERAADALDALFDRLATGDGEIETVTLPFGLGQAPLAAALSAPTDHTLFHAAQLEYLQTCLGDRDWHMGE